MKKFNKVMNISFEVLTDQEEGATNEEIISALVRRIVTLNDDEIQEAVSEDDCADADEMDEVRHNRILAKVNEKRQELVDDVIDKIHGDVWNEDMTAVDELLKTIPTHFLKGYLPE